MTKRVLAIFVFILFCIPASFPGQQEKSLSLSLEDCILKAMKTNLGLAVSVLNPELADISVSLANEKFMPSLSMSYNKRDTNEASYSWLDAEEQVSTAHNSYSLQLSQLIPTGGSFSIALNSYKNDTTRSFQTINPRYGSTLTFNFAQPLLKDFGFKTSRREILIAQNRRDISESQFF